MPRELEFRANSCFVANGPKGEAFKARIVNDFLTKGGDLYLSSLQMTANPVEYLALKTNAPKPPDWVRDLAQPLGYPLGLVTSAELLRGQGYTFPVKNRIEILHIPAMEKRWKSDLSERVAELDQQYQELQNQDRRPKKFVQAKLKEFMDVPLSNGKKLGKLTSWDTSNNKWSWAATGELSDPNEVQRITNELNEKKIPGLRAQPWIFPRDQADTVPGIILNVEYYDHDRNKVQREKLRRDVTQFVNAVGQRGDDTEKALLAQARRDIAKRVEAKELTPAEGEAANRIAVLQIVGWRERAAKLLVKIRAP